MSESRLARWRFLRFPTRQYDFLEGDRWSLRPPKEPTGHNEPGLVMVTPRAGRRLTSLVSRLPNAVRKARATRSGLYTPSLPTNPLSEDTHS